MLRTKTCLILGAGASYDAGLPLGEQLQRQVRHKLNKQNLHVYFKSILGDKLNDHELKQQIDTIAGSIVAARSIDDFIDAQRHVPAIVRLGKLLVTLVIAEGENAAAHRFQNEWGEVGVPGGPTIRIWYKPFFDCAFSRLRIEDYKDHPDKLLAYLAEHLSVVTFNYDRSFEESLVRYMIARFGYVRDTAVSILERLPIFHVYGQLELLSNVRAFPFGAPPLDASGSPSNGFWDFAQRAIANIRTIHEARVDAELIGSVHSAIGGAHTILMVGHSYQFENFDLIATPVAPHTTIFASALGLSSHAIQDARRHALRKFEVPEDRLQMEGSWTAEVMFRTLLPQMTN